MKMLQKKEKIISHLSLRESGLDGDNKKYLLKFLDVTKSQLFFAKGVILVEGISEALLLPIFAEKLGYDLLKSGVEIVNIEGVAFEHFAKLFNSADDAKNLASRCAIITDNDKNMETNEIPSRAKNAEGYIKANLNVFLSDITFEKELYDKNEDLIKNIYHKIHSQTTIDNVSDLIKKLESNKDKSELAHRLAVKLNDGNLSRLRRLQKQREKPNTKVEPDEAEEAYTNFSVPQYIKNALKWVIEGKVDVQQPVE